MESESPMKNLLCLFASALLLTGCEPEQSEGVKVTGVTLSPKTLTLEIGAKRLLAPAITPDNADNKAVSWESGDEAIATVSDTGEVTAVAEGVVAIAAITDDGGKVAICGVRVIAPRSRRGSRNVRASLLEAHPERQLNLRGRGRNAFLQPFQQPLTLE